jgi:magnesium transporter
MLAMAGTTRDDVISESVMRSARLRMPWLFAAFLMEMLAMRVIHRGERALGDLFVSVALFMPAISAMCGNVGVQASTIVVRGLATGRIQRHDSFPVFWRECRTTMVMAVSYGAFIMLVSRQVLGESLMFSIVVGAGLLVSMVLASAFGTLVPIAFHAMKVDPAIATGPLVTTSMDVLAFGTYLTLASWLLLK